MDDEVDLPLTDYVAVVLAGGVGTRMGRNKLLMEISARPMIRHVVETIRGVFETVVVVTGHQRERVEETLERSSVSFVDSPATEGVEAAIRTGIQKARALTSEGSCKGFVLCIGDQPRLTEREIVGLIEFYEDGDKNKPIVPVRDDKRGYPVIIPPDFDLRDLELASESATGDIADHMAVFPTKNPVYDSSVDTPEDYRTFFAI